MRPPLVPGQDLGYLGNRDGNPGVSSSLLKGQRDFSKRGLSASVVGGEGDGLSSSVVGGEGDGLNSCPSAFCCSLVRGLGQWGHVPALGQCGPWAGSGQVQAVQAAGAVGWDGFSLLLSICLIVMRV